MAVNIQFDSSYNPLPPTVVLAQKDGTKLGVLPDHDLVYKRCFNAYSEMSFDIIKSETVLWDKVVDFKLIWAKEWDVWFECYVKIDEDDTTHKHVTCRSLGEAELSQINIYGMEINTEDDILREDYKPTILYDGLNDEKSLLTKLLKKAPHYTVRHVDNSVRYIQRTFSFNDQNIYNCLQDVAQEENLYISYVVKSDEYGKPYRCISVYDLESYCLVCGERGDFTNACPKCGSPNIRLGYGDDSRIYINRENIADTISYETNVDAVKNCFKLEGGDDLMTAAILSCNPNGSSYLWYIPDETKEDMPDALVTRLGEYDELYDYYQNEHEYSPNSTIRSEYNTLVTKYAGYHTLNTIPETITGFPDLMVSLYDTIDFNLLLESGLTPDSQAGVEASGSSAQEQANRITAARMSPLCFISTSTLTQATVNNAALLMAKSIIDSSKYQVKLVSGSGTSSWSGTFRITSFYDETDTVTKSVSGVTVSEDREGYVNQMANRTLASAAGGSEDVLALFNQNEASFEADLPNYSLHLLEIFLDACQAAMNVLIEQGAGTDQWSEYTDDLYDDLYTPLREKSLMIQDEIAVRQSEIDTILHMQDYINDEVYAIQTALDFENFLGETLWKIFSSYRREDTYNNPNYISDGLTNAELFDRALEFIETARKDIYKSAKLQHSLSSTLKNFLVMREFAGLTDYFEVGNWIHVRCDEKIYHLRLLEYEIDFANLDEIKVTFSDVKDTMDGVSDLESVMDSNRMISSTYDSVSRQAKRGNQSRAYLDGWQQRGLDLSQMKILNDADSQEYIFDSHGMLFRKLYDITDSYDDKQLKILNSSIFFTDDNWESVKTAIGYMYFIDPRTNPPTVREAYGVNGEVIIGKLILGEELGIYNSGATMSFTDEGLFISNEAPGYNYTSIRIDPNRAHSFIRAYTTNTLGAETDFLTVDNLGNLTITGCIQATSGYIGGSTGWTIDSNCIYNGKPTLASANNGVYIGTDGIHISYTDTNDNNTVKTAFKVNKSNGQVDIAGYVTFTGLNNTLNTHFDNKTFTQWESDMYSAFASGTTTINGGCIQTGLILAQYLSLYGLRVKKRNNYGDDLSPAEYTFTVDGTTGAIEISGTVHMDQYSSIVWDALPTNDPLHGDIVGDLDLSDVAFSGDYDDLENTPTIPTVPGYIESTRIYQARIESPTIYGGRFYATGLASDSDYSNTEPAYYLFAGYNQNTQTLGTKIGYISYDTNGAGTVDESANRVIFKSLNHTPIKIISSSNMSLEVPDNYGWIYLSAPSGGVRVDSALCLHTSCYGANLPAAYLFSSAFNGMLFFKTS